MSRVILNIICLARPLPIFDRQIYGKLLTLDQRPQKVVIATCRRSASFRKTLHFEKTPDGMVLRPQSIKS